LEKEVGVLKKILTEMEDMAQYCVMGGDAVGIVIIIIMGAHRIFFHEWAN